MIAIALLKGVNVAGQKLIAMARLRAACEKLDCGEVQSLLQSGNLVFRNGKRNGPALELLLEEALEKRLKLKTDVFVRTGAQWRAIVAANPFKKEATAHPGRLIVMFLKSVPAGSLKALQDAIKGAEKVRLIGTELYVVYPDGAGRSNLTNALIERHLGASCTGRNWNTVLKLAALS